MKIFFTFVLLVSSGACFAAMSSAHWQKFCDAQTEPNILNSCVRVDYVCELEGYETERCQKARREVVNKPAHPGKLEK
jgi:hypothetical protein